VEEEVRGSNDFLGSDGKVSEKLDFGWASRFSPRESGVCGDRGVDTAIKTKRGGYIKGLPNRISPLNIQGT